MILKSRENAPLSLSRGDFLTSTMYDVLFNEPDPLGDGEELIVKEEPGTLACVARA